MEYNKTVQPSFPLCMDDCDISSAPSSPHNEPVELNTPSAMDGNVFTFDQTHLCKPQHRAKESPKKSDGHLPHTVNQRYSDYYRAPISPSPELNLPDFDGLPEIGGQHEYLPRHTDPLAIVHSTPTRPTAPISPPPELNFPNFYPELPQDIDGIDLSSYLLHSSPTRSSVPNSPSSSELSLSDFSPEVPPESDGQHANDTQFLPTDQVATLHSPPTSFTVPNSPSPELNLSDFCREVPPKSDGLHANDTQYEIRHASFGLVLSFEEKRADNKKNYSDSIGREYQQKFKAKMSDSRKIRKLIRSQPLSSSSSTTSGNGIIDQNSSNILYNRLTDNSRRSKHNYPPVNTRTMFANENPNPQQQEFKCDPCNLTFQNKNDYRVHLNTTAIPANWNPGYRCDPCDLTFKTFTDLQVHLITRIRLLKGNLISQPKFNEFKEFLERYHAGYFKLICQIQALKHNQNENPIQPQ